MSEWRRSSSCDSSACVEVRFFDTLGTMAIRDSEDRWSENGFTKAAWIAFIEGVKRGEFDWPEETPD